MRASPFRGSDASTTVHPHWRCCVRRQSSGSLGVRCTRAISHAVLPCFLLWRHSAATSREYCARTSQDRVGVVSILRQSVRSFTRARVRASVVDAAPVDRWVIPNLFRLLAFVRTSVRALPCSGSSKPTGKRQHPSPKPHHSLQGDRGPAQYCPSPERRAKRLGACCRRQRHPETKQAHRVARYACFAGGGTGVQSVST
jgi:hypothetical protein